MARTRRTEMKKDRFFAVEGIDGSGKTTQIKILGQKLREKGYPVFVSKACPQNKKSLVRKFMADFGFKMNSVEAMFLFQALHRQQYERTKDALIRGDVVLADRWNSSFWIYHQYFGPLKDYPQYLKVLDDIAFQELHPTFIFLLNLPAEIAIRRKEQQIQEDFYERKSLGIYIRARDYYLKLASENNNWIIVDAAKTIEEVNDEIWNAIKDYF